MKIGVRKQPQETSSALAPRGPKLLPPVFLEVVNEYPRARFSFGGGSGGGFLRIFPDFKIDSILAIFGVFAAFLGV